MRYWIAAGLTFAGGVALSAALEGEGAVNMVGLVGVPGLLLALFAAPALSSARPGDLGRVAAGGSVLLLVGLLLLFAVSPRWALFLALLGALALTLGWPLAASAACVMAVGSVRAVRARNGPRVWSRMTWTWLLALAATYGFGLTHFDDAMQDVKDRVCRATPDGAVPNHDGGQSLLPLSDTSCGADTVPGYVNPLLAVLAALVVVCVAGYGSARLRAGRPRPAS
ncbi:hypothetical protein [Actinomadura harenae]|uniref:Uncharacterized protein n=1 Tax=Actinomadura harenae TaxID=2483351 RepID=A0A3M2L3C8_9ACTN|nr:hypothetical protein [Actinomadura harenae]RMI32051.1 hypothetical protein EBO15_42200 [Actinomadura harenae]